MGNFQQRTGVFLPSREGNKCLNTRNAHGKPDVTDMNRKLSITFTKIPGHDDTALILEVIAGEVRRGRLSGNETEFSWARATT
jgi:hypothetical protein